MHGLLAEHLRAGGDAVVIWLMKVLNATVELDFVPEVFNSGLVVPVYKGGGKHPLKTDRYREVTLTSMVANSGVVRGQNTPGHIKELPCLTANYLWLHVVLHGNFYSGLSKFYLGQARVGLVVATPLVMRSWRFFFFNAWR